MKVLAGSLTDMDRNLIVESNRTYRSVLIAARHACRMDEGRCLEPMQAVGRVGTYTHDYVSLTNISGSFETRVPWESIVGVWWLDEAPSEVEIDAMLATPDTPFTELERTPDHAD